MIDPSRNPTMECTIDCGCTSTSIRSGLTSKSACASIISSALLNMVALSMEIRSPMSQFGCALASAGVTLAMRAIGQSRNGPPEAVRMIRSTSATLSPISA